MGRLVAAVLLCLAFAAEADARPRVCLVLSGGGARGAAHIGVLKVLEEYRVPIDCIAGTSMGALVGAAYATGMSVADMEKLVEELSTEALFKERPPRQELSVRRKQEDQLNLVGPEIGVRDGQLYLQKGFATGIQLETVLRRISRVKGYQRFDELPIPFRAVATDLVSGRVIVFGEGELPAVMRASMSVPGFIAPTEIGDMLLIDGGLTNNLPVNVAKEMNADVIIAVNLGTPLLERKHLGSIVGVSAQMIFILTEQNVQASIATLGANDVLIEPQLGEFSFGDFDNMEKTLPIGEAAARKAQGFLRRLTLAPEEYAALRAKQGRVQAPDVRIVDAIRFEDLQRVSPESLLRLLDTKAGQALDTNVLDRDIRRMYGTGDFESINYKLVEEGGRNVLNIEAVEKAWGPGYLRFGLGLTYDFEGDSHFDFLASYRRTWLNARGLEWRTDLALGRTTGILSELYQPFSAGSPFFVAPYIDVRQFPIDIYDGNRRFARFLFRYARIGSDLGIQFGQYGEARVGVLAGTLNAKLNTGPPELVGESDTVRQGAFTARLFFDQLDSMTFPRNGAAAHVDLYASRPGLGAEDSYTKVSALGDVARSFGDNTFTLGFAAGKKTGKSEVPDYDLFTLGGFMRLSGYPTDALLGDEMQFGRFMYYRRLARQTLLDGVYAGFSLEAGKMGGAIFPTQPTGWIRAGSVYLGLDTFLGPLYIGFGRASPGYNAFYLYLGRPWKAY
jgi:NTE family protein